MPAAGARVFTDMEAWSEIRRKVLVLGVPRRAIQREYGLHWTTLKKILREPEPPGYRRKEPKPAPKSAPFVTTIEAILRADRDVHRKQRHTAKRIWQRLKAEHGATLSYSRVKEVIAESKRRAAEVFVPLMHAPGEAQVDFGHADLIVDGEPWKGALFVMTLPYSGALFVCAFPRECPEAFLTGHVLACAYFGGVPHRISYDNTSCAVAKITGKRTRVLTADFLRLQSRYLFAAHFCLVRRPNEKGVVETLIGFARRNFLVPVPRVAGFTTLNATLLTACRDDLDRAIRGQERTKAALLDEERAKLLPLPAEACVARRIATTRASSESLVRFDRNDYSVPTEFAHREIVVSGGIDDVSCAVDGGIVATHRRCWKKERTIFDPVHYFALLERKPGALDFALPLASFTPPANFGVLRRRLEAEFGDRGTREYVRVLRLLEHATPAALEQAVARALDLGTPDAAAVRLILEHAAERACGVFRLDGRPQLQLVRVAAPDLAAYGALRERA